jgi:large subunit ribosomal protein L4
VAAPKAPKLPGAGDVTLDEAVFGERFHNHLVHQAVRAELLAKRAGTASTLGRGEVAMTGAKAWRQKGTGRARVGALSAGQRVGGGVTFGPKPRGFAVKVNKKARRRALRAALSLHADRRSLAVLDAGGFDAPSTKEAVKALDKLGGDGKVLVVLVDGEENALKSFRNLQDVTVLHVNQAGVADVVGAARLVLSEPALERLTQIAAVAA